MAWNWEQLSTIPAFSGAGDLNKTIAWDGTSFSKAPLPVIDGLTTIDIGDVPADVTSYFTDVSYLIDVNTATGNLSTNATIDINAGSTTAKVNAGGIVSRIGSPEILDFPTTLTISQSKLKLVEPYFRSTLTSAQTLTIDRSEVLIEGKMFAENLNITISGHSTVIVRDGAILCKSLVLLEGSTLILEDSNLIVSYTGDGTVGNITMINDNNYTTTLYDGSSLVAYDSVTQVLGSLRIYGNSRVIGDSSSSFRIGATTQLRDHSSFISDNTVYMVAAATLSLKDNSFFRADGMFPLGNYDTLPTNTYLEMYDSTLVLNTGGSGGLSGNSLSYTGTSTGDITDVRYKIYDNSIVVGDIAGGAVTHQSTGTAEYVGPLELKNGSTMFASPMTATIPFLIQDNSTLTFQTNPTSSGDFRITGSYTYGLELYDNSQLIVPGNIRLRIEGPAIKMTRNCLFKQTVAIPTTDQTFTDINSPLGFIECYGGGNTVVFEGNTAPTVAAIDTAKDVIYAEGSVNVKYEPSTSNFGTVRAFLKATGPNVFVEEDTSVALRFEYVDNYTTTPATPTYSLFNPTISTIGDVVRQDYLTVIGI